MPIKQFPPPAFLNGFFWQVFGEGLNEHWQLVAELDSELDGNYGENVTYLILFYRAGNYSLHLRVRNEYASPDQYNPHVGSSILSDKKLWEGNNPNVEELDILVTSEYKLSGSIQNLFPVDEDDRDYWDDRFVYAPDCEFEYMRLYGE